VPVTFHTEQITFNLKQKLQHKRWIKLWIETQDAVCGNLAFIFTSNKHIRLINHNYLNHNYFTDVITFDYTEEHIISGDIFISIEQVNLNAESYGTDAEEELRRVMIHGVMHLLGHNDSNVEEKKTMRYLENEALHLWLKMS
jgi:probable rRNA maturation factor